MRKFVCYFSFLFLFLSCQEHEESKDMKISAYVVDDIQSKATKSSFSDGDKLGIFATLGTLSSPYAGVSSNVECLFNGSTWISEPIYLTGKSATVYAYFPHSTSAGKGTVIPVETASQTDYMYGKGDREVNSVNPELNIEMKHALAKLSFKIRKVDYDAKAILKSISVTGGNGYKFSTTGTLDCEKGIIISDNINGGSTAINCNEVLSNSFIQSHEILVIPFGIPITQDGNIVLHFTISTDIKDEIYTVPIPAYTAWEKGNSYVYPLTLNGLGLHLNSTDVTIEGWGNTLSGGGSTN